MDIAIKPNFSNAATRHSQFFIVEDPHANGSKAIEIIQEKTGQNKIQVNGGKKLKYETDIVIAGGGLSGLSAALTASENGAQAIVLEKMRFLGGAGLYPEGSLGIGTRIQKEKGIHVTTEKVFARVMEFHHWRCNATVIRTLLNESGSIQPVMIALAIQLSSSSRRGAANATFFVFSISG